MWRLSADLDAYVRSIYPDLPEEWTIHTLKGHGVPDGCYATGSVAPVGKDGWPNWRKEDKSKSRTVFIPDSIIHKPAAKEEAWSIDANNAWVTCNKCGWQGENRPLGFDDGDPMCPRCYASQDGDLTYGPMPADALAKEGE
jgi:hypothetical protein